MFYKKNNDESKGVVVIKRPNETLDSMIKRFKRKVMQHGIIDEFRARVSYEKPSVKKRRKHRESIYRIRKEELKKQIIED